MKLLELFKGSGSVSKVAIPRGYEVVSLDYDKKFNPDICSDILKWDYESFSKDFVPDFIWASPPCNTFSPLAYPLKERDTKTAKPLSQRAIRGTNYLYRTIRIIRHFRKLNPNLCFVIENPRGMMRNDKHMKKFYLANTYYFFYGFNRRKSTDFFSNFELDLVNPKVTKMTKHERDNYQRIQRETTLLERYAIPPLLIETILNQFEDLYDI